MNRKLTLRRPRILTGFMLLFEAAVGETTQVLANGSVLEFDITDGEQVLTLTAMNNPNVKAPAPLTLPAGEADCTVSLTFKSIHGRAQWFWELE